jgi:type I restriction enzyme R subunit
MLSEAGFVDKPILQWLCGHPKRPSDTGLGWIYLSPRDLEKRGRPTTDPLLEWETVAALIRINRADGLDTEAKARIALAALRERMNHPDPLTANRRTLEALAQGVPVVLKPGRDAVTVRFVELRPERAHDNAFHATRQFEFKQGETPRYADLVCFVNGIPVVLIEDKCFETSRHDWREGVNQLHRYQREAPLLLAANVFAVAADEEELRFGAVAPQAATQHEIDLQRDGWAKWESLYPEIVDYWNKPEGERLDDALEAACRGLLRPATLVDFIGFFHVFETETKGGAAHTKKKLARYQQFEAANLIVDRVVKQAVEEKSGLIWHTQGSGKSLTMIFAAYKLRRHPAMENPAVYVVVDRSDLKRQIHEDFEDCDYPNVEKALGIDDLKDKVRTRRQGTFITTIQCFQRMDDLAPWSEPKPRVVLLVDEAHRSQKGLKNAGFAMTMRAKLATAARFGFTGTPIDETMVNTHREFGPMVDGKQERYLSYYGIRKAILDGATLPVVHVCNPVPLKVEKEKLSASFEQMCAEQEVTDEDEKTELQRKEASWRQLVRDDRRVKIVVERMVKHFLEHPDPSGFKAQLVAVDREVCGLYHAALEEALLARGLGAEWGVTDVIVSRRQNDLPELKRYTYTDDEIEEKIAWFKLKPDEWEEWNRQNFGDERTQWKPALKILVVCNMLLTGFDAPIEQVLYLDKPLRDHNLLQAMARTNRPLPELKKENGLVVDFFGVFSNVEKALNFNEQIREEVLIDWDKLGSLVAPELATCLAFFDGIERKDTRECYLATRKRLRKTDVAREFTSSFKRLESLWEAISPDPVLYPMARDYVWLCGVYVSYRRRIARSPETRAVLAAKTRALIREHTSFLDVAEELPVYTIDADYVVKARKLPTPADRAAEIVDALTKEIAENEADPAYQELGERVARIADEQESEVEITADKLAEYEALVADLVRLKEEPARLGLTEPGEYKLFALMRAQATGGTEAEWVVAAKKVVGDLKKSGRLVPGWSETVGGKKPVALLIQVYLITEGHKFGLCSPTESDPEFVERALEEIKKQIA